MRNEGGSLLMTVIGLIAILAIGATLMMSSSSNTATAVYTRRLNYSKQMLFSQIKRYATIPASLRNSIATSPPLTPSATTFGNFPTNNSLNACITGSGACPCNKATDFILQNPFFSGPSVGGTTNSPVYYDQMGNPCSAALLAAKNCPLYVTTQFTADCAGNIQVSFTVGYAATPIGTAPAQKTGGLTGSSTSNQYLSTPPQAVPIASISSLNDPLPVPSGSY